MALVIFVSSPFGPSIAVPAASASASNASIACGDNMPASRSAGSDDPPGPDDGGLVILLKGAPVPAAGRPGQLSQATPLTQLIRHAPSGAGTASASPIHTC